MNILQAIQKLDELELWARNRYSLLPLCGKIEV